MTFCPITTCVDAAGDRTEADGVCDAHRRKVARALADLPRLYVQLAGALGVAGGGSDGPRVSTSSELKVPINLEARAAQEDIVRSLAVAEDDWRIAQGWEWTPHRGREAVRLVGHVRFLAAHLAALLDVEAGVTLALEVLQLRRRAVKVLGLDRLPPRRVPGFCPSCGDETALHHEDGADIVTCHACGQVLDEAAYDAAGIELAA